MQAPGSTAKNSAGLLLSAALVLFLLAYYWPWLSGQQTFFFKDTTDFFEPLCKFIGGTLAAGRLPMWNPYSYCGMSQAAISSPSLFFPLNWLFAVLTFSQALAVIMLVSQLVCAVGTYLLVASFGFGRLPAALAALTVSLSGYMFSLSSNYTLVAGAAWVPLILHCSRRCLEANSRRWLVANAVATFMMLSAGRPEISGPALLLVVGYVLFESLSAFGLRTSLPALGRFAASLAIGFLLAMPVLLPLAEWVPWSRRAQGLPTYEVLLYSANWYNLLCLFVPEPLGTMQLRDSPFADQLESVARVPYYGSAFVGSLILALAIMGLGVRAGKRTWAVAGLLAVSIVVALGQNIPGMERLVDTLPGASFLRFPNKALFFSILCLALLAARGACLYLNGSVRIKTHLLGWCALAVGWAALFFITVRTGDLLLPFTAGASHDNAVLAQTIVGLRGFVHAGIATLGVFVLGLLPRFDRRRLALYLVTVLAFAMLAFNAFSNCAIAGPRDYFTKPSFLAQALHLRPDNWAVRVTHTARSFFTLPPAVLTADRLVSTINNFQFDRQMLRQCTNMDFRIPSAGGFEGAMVGDYYYSFLSACFQSSQYVGDVHSVAINDLVLYRLLQTTSTQYVVSQVYHFISPGKMESIKPMDPSCFDVEMRNEPANIQVFRLKRPLPRAYFAARWRAFATHDDVVACMASCPVTGFDPEKETLVEHRLAANVVMNKEITPVTLADLRPEQVQADVTTDGDRLLVLQDQFYPGWYVSIDGHPAELLRCNGFTRGVVVPAGRHRITFIFKPLSLRLGVALALLGIALCLFVLRTPRSGS